MYRGYSKPCSLWWGFFSGSWCGGRRFYTRQERIERLEKTKQALEKDLAAIEERFQDLKSQETKAS